MVSLGSPALSDGSSSRRTPGLVEEGFSSPDVGVGVYSSGFVPGNVETPFAGDCGVLGPHPQDDTSSVASDKTVTPDEARSMAYMFDNPAVKAAYVSNRNEREELIAARKLIQDLQGFIVTKGLSLQGVQNGLAESTDLFNAGLGMPSTRMFIDGRYELGLPSFVKDSCKLGEAAKVFADLPNPNLKDLHGASGVAADKGKAKVVEPSSLEKAPGAAPVQGGPDVGGLSPPAKSWSTILRTPHVSGPSFEYCPLPQGCNVVTPPDEVLLQGIEKFKCCLVGTFTKGSLSYHKVMECAQKAWNSRGLCSTSQKDSNQFLFKFNSVSEMNGVLARGIWYFDRKPLVLCAWGKSVGVERIHSMPLWVKFSNIPDYYWTEKGLSHLASAVGLPVCADKLTAQLNPLAFARMCVTYSYGAPLPEKITVASLDPISGEKVTTDVQVSYPLRPLSCDGCKSLGHSSAACPLVKRVWVQKQSAAAGSAPPPADLHKGSSVRNGGVQKNEPSSKVCNTEEWIDVSKKHSFGTTETVGDHNFEDTSPPLTNTFKNLRGIDELDLKQVSRAEGPVGTPFAGLSKSQRKRLKRKQGGSSPSIPH